MTNDLQQIELHLSHLTNKKIIDFAIDAECLEYSGYSFKLDDLKIKYRQAKVTPKKVGLFVTLWKRNNENKTEPFNVNDPFDFYIIATKQEDYSGFFIFPKDVLSEKGILTNSKKEGKRGFRVYPDWTKTENNQATKTKAWQVAYFIGGRDNTEAFTDILKGKTPL
ncbi:MAG: MepB family protein [Myroides sp.]